MLKCYVDVYVPRFIRDEPNWNNCDVSAKTIALSVPPMIGTRIPFDSYKLVICVLSVDVLQCNETDHDVAVEAILLDLDDRAQLETLGFVGHSTQASIYTIASSELLKQVLPMFTYTRMRFFKI